MTKKNVATWILGTEMMLVLVTMSTCLQTFPFSSPLSLRLTQKKKSTNNTHEIRKRWRTCCRKKKTHEYQLPIMYHCFYVHASEIRTILRIVQQKSQQYTVRWSGTRQRTFIQQNRDHCAHVPRNNRAEEIAQNQMNICPRNNNNHSNNTHRSSVRVQYISSKQHKLTFDQPASSDRWPLLLLDCRPSCCWFRRFVVVETERWAVTAEWLRSGSVALWEYSVGTSLDYDFLIIFSYVMMCTSFFFLCTQHHTIEETKHTCNGDDQVGRTMCDRMRTIPLSGLKLCQLEGARRSSIRYTSLMYTHTQTLSKHMWSCTHSNYLQ